VLFGGDDDDEAQSTAAIDPLLEHFEPSQETYDQLLCQHQQRLSEGGGETIYEIGMERGLSEEQLAGCLATLQRIGAETECVATEIHRTPGTEGVVMHVLVRSETHPDRPPLELRVAVCGNVDSGKSTLVSCLTRGIQDNGRGSARQAVFRHAHEISTGRTSSVSTQIMGFNATGDAVTSGAVRQFVWSDVVEGSSKVISFIDLGGHEKYLKTTMFGLTGHVPHYVMLSIGSNMGLVGMTKEHLGIALALHLPVYVVITKVDMCPENILEQTITRLTKVLKHPAVKKIPFFIKTDDDVVKCARSFPNGRIVPIFQVSSVTGHNYPALRNFLNLLPVRDNLERDSSAPMEMHIDDIFSVPGVGTVVAGNMLGGMAEAGGNYLIGPNCFGEWEEVGIKSIHNNRTPVKQVVAGQNASFGLKKVKRAQVRKGMVVVAKELQPAACWEFDAEVLVLYHSTTIQVGYEAVVHCHAVRQSARILSMDTETLRTRDRALVRFRFMFRPEYMRTEAKLMFREGKTKGTGIVKTIHYLSKEATGDLKSKGS